MSNLIFSRPSTMHAVATAETQLPKLGTVKCERQIPFVSFLSVCRWPRSAQCVGTYYLPTVSRDPVDTRRTRYEMLWHCTPSSLPRRGQEILKTEGICLCDCGCILDVDAVPRAGGTSYNRTKYVSFLVKSSIKVL